MAFSKMPSEGRDILRTFKADQTINGLGGNDRISSVHDGSKLFGGDGKDWLSTTLKKTVIEGEVAPALTAFQSGGDGDDHLFFSGLVTETTGSSVTFNVELDGGDGDDEIWADIFGLAYVWVSSVIDGGDGVDFITVNSDVGFPDGGGGKNNINAGGGDDVASAYVSNGFLGDAQNIIWGGQGDDEIDADVYSDSGLNKLYGGDGNDKISASGLGDLDNYVYGGDGDDDIDASATGAADIPTVTSKAYGGNGDDKITLFADTGDLPSYASAYNSIYGGNGHDTLTATALIASNEYDGGSKLYGGNGSDRLRVYGGTENTLDGGTGNDTLTGGGADDTLIGGSGADVLKGAGGDDTFTYLWMTGTKTTTRDTILDFGFGSKSRGDDVIDLSEIDANVKTSGNQAFKFGGTTKKGTGYVWIEESSSGSGSFVKAKNGGAETLIIAVADGTSSDASDWSVSDFLL